MITLIMTILKMITLVMTILRVAMLRIHIQVTLQIMTTLYLILLIVKIK